MNFSAFSGLMKVSTTIPYSEGINFAETSHPIGIPPQSNWMQQPDKVTQDIVITVQGVKSGYYVCMNSRGKVYGAVSTFIIYKYPLQHL